MPFLPEAFHDTAVYISAATYWYKEGEAARGDRFMKKYELGVAKLMTDYTSATSDPVIDDGEDRMLINPNLVISL